MQQKSLFIIAFTVALLIALTGIYEIVGQTSPPLNCPSWSYGEILSNSLLRGAVERYDSDNNKKINYLEKQNAYDDYFVSSVITQEEYCAVKLFYDRGYELPTCAPENVCFTPGETCCENNKEYICTADVVM